MNLWSSIPWLNSRLQTNIRGDPCRLFGHFVHHNFRTLACKHAELVDSLDKPEASLIVWWKELMYVLSLTENGGVRGWVGGCFWLQLLCGFCFNTVSTQVIPSTEYRRGVSIRDMNQIRKPKTSLQRWGCAQVTATHFVGFGEFWIRGKACSRWRLSARDLSSPHLHAIKDNRNRVAINWRMHHESMNEESRSPGF